MRLDSIFKKNKDAAPLSIPQVKTVHGVEIRKLPNGAYLKALNAIQDMPEVILKGCFPGMDPDDILEEFKNISVDMIPVLAGKLLANVPEQFLKFLSELTEIPYERLMNELTPKETMDVLDAMWELNDLTDFFKKLKGKVMGSKKIQEMMNNK
jgi:hypothetical protein